MRAKAPRRPPEVSAAEWKRWTPAYRKRSAGFYKAHPGAPRYQMRGKGAAEHLTRKARLDARITALSARQAYHGKDHGARSAAEIAATWYKVIAREGEGVIARAERQFALAHQAWVEDGSPWSGKGRGGYGADLHNFLNEIGYFDDDGDEAEGFYK